MRESDIRRALIERRPLATEEELRRCEQLLDGMRKKSPGATLVQVLLETGVVTKAQLQRLQTDLTRNGGDQDSGKNNVPQQIPGYQIISKLGQGAMAVVYKARQVNLDRVVAVKVLPKRLSANAEFVDRFEKEGKAAARLNHPNIVQAIDVGVEPGGYHYFVMEFVEGVTVYDEMEKRGTYDEQEALRLTLQVARALAHAHEKGFIHRDVKPKNIMVTPDRIAKLADMGLARQMDDTDAAKQEKGKAYGTPYYIAPEQIRGEMDIDFRADIYSLGATLYHMVTGRVPYDGATPTEVMRKHLKERLTPPDHINRKLSSGVSEVVEVMMAKNRADRYKSTKELLMDLEAIASGNPPLQARQMFGADDLHRLSESEDSGGMTVHAASLNSLHAEYGVKLTGINKQFWLLYGVIAVLVILHIVRFFV